MAIRAVIFDMGGVLLRTEDKGPRERLAARLGLTYKALYRQIFDNESALLATVGKVSSQDHWKAVQTALSLQDDELLRLKDEFWEGDRLDQELLEYIRSLRPRFKTGLLSNAWDELRQLLETRYKILDYFDDVIISAEIGVAKPDPRIYDLAVRRLEVVPEKAVFVDDFIENIESARQSGLYTVHFRSSEQARAELDALLNERPVD
jgi:glucose-1-phosphatase